MQLKDYQAKVIQDLNRFMELLNHYQNSTAAYRAFWFEKSITVGSGGMRAYRDILEGVPQICFKVPTGGGKTFLACNSIRPIFDGLPALKAQVVVWLVPSDAILEQTVKNLKNPDHFYRQKINMDFGGRVEVYTKQELLNGQNFNPTAVTEQLSIMVLSFDSFRSRGDGLKAYKENGSLAPFAKVFGKPEQPIENADETALFQVINQLNPLVIVDESHHAKTPLSNTMLENFNPCFVLELTATPKEESNIISYVDAVQLKKENMVKLPVIVYNRDKKEDVLVDAIDLRATLEQLAIAEEKLTGKYIRPIVLFQAQPKGKEDSTTFEELRSQLEKAGIPKKHIAIKTANINELKNVDLLSKDCEIRYIITINALKEGWDCPFAYILATLANKTSQIDVEQILGRVLRQPHTCRHKHPGLNNSYVLTSSNDFGETLKRILKGLNNAGFSEKECREGTMVTVAPEAKPYEGTQVNLEDLQSEEEYLDFDPNAVKQMLDHRQEQQTDASATALTGAAGMLAEAEKVTSEYEADIDRTAQSTGLDIPQEVREKMKIFPVNAEFREEIEKLRIPQFVIKTQSSIFCPDGIDFLDEAALTQGFSLKKKSSEIDFASADDELFKLDLEEKEGSVPKIFKMESAEQQYFKEYFNSLPDESRIRGCKHTIHRQLNKMDGVDSDDLKDYIDRIIDGMTKEELAALEKAPQGYAKKIKDKIERLLREHRREKFDLWLRTNKVVCEPIFQLPEHIAPMTSTNIYGKSLYVAEDGNINKLEDKFIRDLTALPNVRWWHRNIPKHGLCLNGFRNHYPDIIIMTESGTIVLAETKGNDRDGSDSKQKIELGNAWANAAGRNYQYYMVFDDAEAPLEGAVTLSQFIEILKEL